MTDTPTHDRQHWHEAPPEIRRNIEGWLDMPDPDGKAASVRAAVNQAWDSGYCWPSDEVPTPAHDRVKALEKAGRIPEAHEARVSLSLELSHEEHAIREARQWEATAAHIDAQREEKQAQRQAKAHDARVNAEVSKRLAEQQAERERKAAARLRKQVAAEMEQTNA